MEKTIPLSENIEDYLETILALQTRNTVARSKDIAERLDIKRGSVTGMLKKLAARKLINYEPYGYVTLTPEGRKSQKKLSTAIQYSRIFYTGSWKWMKTGPMKPPAGWNMPWTLSRSENSWNSSPRWMPVHTANRTPRRNGFTTGFSTRPLWR